MQNQIFCENLKYLRLFVFRKKKINFVEMVSHENFHLSSISMNLKYDGNFPILPLKSTN